MRAKDLKKDEIILINRTKYKVALNNGERIYISQEDNNVPNGWGSSCSYDYGTIDGCKFTMVEIDWAKRLEVAKNGF